MKPNRLSNNKYSTNTVLFVNATTIGCSENLFLVSFVLDGVKLS